MNIFIGNLSKQTTEKILEKKFTAMGTVASCKIIKDHLSGEPKGFAFIEMPNTAEANKAIHELNSTELDGRKITVNEARPKAANNGARNSFSGSKRW